MFREKALYFFLHGLRQGLHLCGKHPAETHMLLILQDGRIQPNVAFELMKGVASLLLDEGQILTEPRPVAHDQRLSKIALGRVVVVDTGFAYSNPSCNIGVTEGIVALCLHQRLGGIENKSWSIYVFLHMQYNLLVG